MTEYLVYGVDDRGERTLLTETFSARSAMTLSNIRNSLWADMVVYDADGPMSRADLEARAAAEEGAGMA